MRAQQMFRWIALTAVLALFATAGFAAALLIGRGSADAAPAPTASTATAVAPSATAVAPSATAVAPSATAVAPSATAGPTVTPAPPVPPITPVTPSPVQPATKPLDVYFARPAGDCVYEAVPYTYQIQGDMNVIDTRLSFLRGELGFGSDLNFLYGLPLSVERVEGDSMWIAVHLRFDQPYTDPCTEHAIFQQLVANFTFAEASSELFINGETVTDFFISRSMESREIGFNPGPDEAWISGELGYPAESIPAMEIHAVSLANPTIRGVIQTAPGDSGFIIQGLAPGDYILEAQVIGAAGGVPGSYTQASLCGLTVDCTDHSPIVISVGPGEHYAGARLNDWYR